jgi:hypothetical protein
VRRRTVISGVGALAALAGCAGVAPPAANDESPTPDGGPVALASADLRVRDQGCGTQVDRATVEFDPAGPTVTVEGTIWGADTCHTAGLAAASYDPDADRLTVRVVSERRETDGTPACGECIVEIDYAVTCRFTGGLPGSVAVVHGAGDRRTVVEETAR